MEPKYLHALPIRELYPQASLLQTFRFSSCAPSSSTTQPNHDSGQTLSSGHLFAGKINRCTAPSSVQYEDFHSPPPSRAVPEELQRQSGPRSGDACISHRTIYKPSLRLFFLSQHIVGNPMKAWVWVEREYNVAGTGALGKSGNLL